MTETTNHQLYASYGSRTYHILETAWSALSVRSVIVCLAGIGVLREINWISLKIHQSRMTDDRTSVRTLLIWCVRYCDDYDCPCVTIFCSNDETDTSIRLSYLSARGHDVVHGYDVSYYDCDVSSLISWWWSVIRSKSVKDSVSLWSDAVNRSSSQSCTISMSSFFLSLRYVSAVSFQVWHPTTSSDPLFASNLTFSIFCVVCLTEFFLSTSRCLQYEWCPLLSAWSLTSRSSNRCLSIVERMTLGVTRLPWSIAIVSILFFDHSVYLFSKWFCVSSMSWL